MAKQEANNKITNKANGKDFMVTNEELSAIQNNKMTKDLYTYEDKVTLPEMSEKIKPAGGTTKPDEVKN